MTLSPKSKQCLSLLVWVDYIETLFWTPVFIFFLNYRWLEGNFKPRLHDIFPIVLDKSLNSQQYLFFLICLCFFVFPWKEGLIESMLGVGDVDQNDRCWNTFILAFSSDELERSQNFKIQDRNVSVMLNVFGVKVRNGLFFCMNQ